MKLLTALVLAFTTFCFTKVFSQNVLTTEVEASAGLLYFSDYDMAYSGVEGSFNSILPEGNKFRVSIGFGYGLNADLYDDFYLNASANYHLKPLKVSKKSSLNYAIGLSYLYIEKSFSGSVASSNVDVQSTNTTIIRPEKYPLLFGLNNRLDYTIDIRDYFSLGIGASIQPLMANKRLNLRHPYRGNEVKLFGGLYLKSIIRF